MQPEPRPRQQQRQRYEEELPANFSLEEAPAHNITTGDFYFFSAASCFWGASLYLVLNKKTLPQSNGISELPYPCLDRSACYAAIETHHYSEHQPTLVAAPLEATCSNILVPVIERIGQHFAVSRVDQDRATTPVNRCKIPVTFGLEVEILCQLAIQVFGACNLKPHGLHDLLQALQSNAANSLPAIE